MEKESEKLINDFIDEKRANKLSENSVYFENLYLMKFASFLGNKSIKYATKENLINFFKTLNSWHTRDMYGAILIQFYRFVFNLDKNTRPDLMKWFNYTTKKQKKMEKNPDYKSKLIEPEDYQKIIDISSDEWGMWKALWET